jgi:hypothetical protein
MQRANERALGAQDNSTGHAPAPNLPAGGGG